jgi:hypothetical protein
MVREFVQQTLADKLESQIAHVEDVLRSDLHETIRTGFRLCSEDLGAQVHDDLREQLSELKVPAGVEEELEGVSRRLAVNDSGLSCLEARVDALRNDTEARVAELIAAHRAIEVAVSQAAAAAAAERAAKLCSSPPRSGFGRETGLIHSELGGAEAGLTQGVTALARVLGLMRKGETLGSGEWAWDRCCVARRLEQAWNVRGLELGASPNAVGRSDIFDLLREVQRPSACSLVGQAADAAAGTGTHLPDRREAARLNAWLQAPPTTHQQRPSSATRERPGVASGLQAPLSASQPLPNRAASWANLEEAALPPEKGLFQTMPGTHGHGEDVRCGSGFRGVAANRRSPSAAGGAARPPRP